MRVALLTTGRMEFYGLPKALWQLFPEHDFTCIPKIAGSDEPWDGFTSAALPIRAPAGGSALDKLVQAMVANIVPGRDGNPPDFLVLLDDLELANADQPEVVIHELRCAVKRHIGTLPHGLAARASLALREKVSFHLAKPMAEAWLFADPAGPGNAGVPSARLPPKLRAGCDPEKFETDDADYDADTGAACSRWSALTEIERKRRRKTEQPEWLKSSRQTRPKSYLAWLARDCSVKKCSDYHEVPQGEFALSRLGWDEALRRPAQMKYLRSFVYDLADALGGPVPENMRGLTAPLTCRNNRLEDPILRNL